MTESQDRPRLSEATLDRLAPAVRPPLRPRPEAAILHLGLGAFHRAHMAEYTEDAEAARPEGWGIVGASLRSIDVQARLAPQNGLYSLLVRDGRTVQARVLGVLRQVLAASEQADEVIARIAVPRTRIVSLTVTEKGYHLDPSSRRLGLDDPPVAADLAPGATPKTPVGLLAAGLAARRARGLGGLTLLCCDNLPENGATLKAALLAFAEAKGGGLADWIEAACRFPSSMVDRIVPATTAEDRAAAAVVLGLDDAAPVVTEAFRQWVVEDDFAAGRPAWDKAGATFVASVAPYELMKLRLLNGSHSAIAYLGLLDGRSFVSEVVGVPELRRFVEGLMAEAAATLPLPTAAYCKALMARFANPALAHRCRQIAMDGSQKLPQRLLAPIRERLERGQPIDHLALAVAAWMRYAAGLEGEGRRDPLEDPLAARIAACGAATDLEARGRALLAIEPIFGPDLPRREDFTAPVLAAYRALWEQGPRGVIRSLRPRTSQHR